MPAIKPAVKAVGVFFEVLGGLLVSTALGDDA
jgi:hypothetical protein